VLWINETRDEVENSVEQQQQQQQPVQPKNNPRTISQQCIRYAPRNMKAQKNSFVSVAVYLLVVWTTAHVRCCYGSSAAAAAVVLPSMLEGGEPSSEHQKQMEQQVAGTVKRRSLHCAPHTHPAHQLEGKSISRERTILLS